MKKNTKTNVENTEAEELLKEYNDQTPENTKHNYMVYADYSDYSDSSCC